MIRHLLAAIAALVGSNLVFGLVLFMNQPVPPRPEQQTGPEVAFAVQPTKKPPEKKPTPQREPPKAKRPPPPSALLGASLAGMSFGIAGLEDVDLTGQSSALLGAGGEVVMTESTVDVAPRPVQRGGVEYPARARAKGIEGFVTLSVLVGEDGAVRDVAVLEAQPVGTFEEAARAALRAWRFEPGLYEGRPVPVRVQQTVRFALE